PTTREPCSRPFCLALRGHPATAPRCQVLALRSPAIRRNGAPMSKANGFLQLRRGLWEHVRDGRLTHIEALVYIYMLTQADRRSGVWNGSAGALAGELTVPKSTAKYALQKLDGSYIRRFAAPGRHFCYPILLHKFLVTDGQHIGLRLDALNSTSPTSL